jgi:hypothetical protein
MVREENGGVMDNNFTINWEGVRNSIMVTNVDGSRKIPTRIFEIIDFK